MATAFPHGYRSLTCVYIGSPAARQQFIIWRAASGLPAVQLENFKVLHSERQLLPIAVTRNCLPPRTAVGLFC